MLVSILLSVLALGFLMFTIVGLAGNGLILVLAIVYAISTDFSTLTGNTLLWLFIMFILGEIWEFGVSFLGIKKEQVSTFTVFFIACGTIIGSLVGTLFMPLVGSLLGASIGAFCFAFIIERLRGETRYRSWYIACVAASMQLLAAFGKIIVGCIMLIMFIVNLAW